MGLYDAYILPWITDIVCSGKSITYQRRKVVPLAKGRVLEIGVGSGCRYSSLAKAIESNLETNRRRVQPEPADPESHRAGRIQD
jgi:hypothetical protein